MKAGLAVEALTLSLGAFRLNGLDFALSRSEILVILGPNGSGKSVTLETIAGFHRPDKGRVLIGGRDVTALPPEGRNIGFVVQNFGLFPHLNVERNVAIAQRGARALAARDPDLPPYGNTAALLAYFGIKQLARRMPQDLSPGEKQRVALARALAGAPDLFLFDEPFSAPRYADPRSTAR
jgi:ABC-type Fe3+/spermidine/putrescine transport system ATPase subunit